MRQTEVSFPCVFVIFIFLASLSYAETDHNRFKIVSNGETVFVDDSVKPRIRGKITTHELDIGKPSDPRPETVRSSCSYSRYPCSIVDSIEISVGGNPIRVPRSVTCDLADLNTGEIRTEVNKNLLILTGADASEAYVVKIEFDAEDVTRRTLSALASPKEVLQETVYHRVSLGD